MRELVLAFILIFLISVTTRGCEANINDQTYTIRLDMMEGEN